MKILHTADWHVGKRLGRYDRMEDHAAVLAEVVEIAQREAVDLVIVAGDLFDRPAPPIDALRLVLETLERLAEAERPVVAIAGNHDSPELFEVLAPLMRSRHVHMVGAIRPPEAGGVLDLETAGGLARVACFPFLRRGRVVDFLSRADAWRGEYADKVAALCERYSRYLAEPKLLESEEAPAVTVLTGHFMVHGALVGGEGAPRGERSLFLGEAYAAPETVVSRGPQYVALGHVHAPQPVPGASSAAEYSGSLLELDFGEAGEAKRVVVVDVEPGEAAEVRSIALERGRRLRRARGTWSELLADETLEGCFLDLTVVTDGPDPGLADRAQEEMPLLVKVRADYERFAEEGPLRAGQPWDALYNDYYRRRHGIEPPAELVDAFREIYTEASDAPA
ncbi:MAG: exonuclease SbcCD subunit D [Acidobacteriota bacterium]